MTSSAQGGSPAGDSDALRAVADRILGRAKALAATPAKDRAIEIARMVLCEAPGFGGRELRDDEIVEILQTEEIGPATFRKALSAVRKELAKKPAPLATRRTKPVTDSQRTGPVTESKASTPSAPPPSMAANIDRKLL